MLRCSARCRARAARPHGGGPPRRAAHTQARRRRKRRPTPHHRAHAEDDAGAVLDAVRRASSGGGDLARTLELLRRCSRLLRGRPSGAGPAPEVERLRGACGGLLERAAADGLARPADPRALRGTLALAGRLAARGLVAPPPSLRRQLVDALLEREDGLGLPDVAGTAQAAASAFRGPLFSEREAAPLLAMLARRAESLLDLHGPPAPMGGPAGGGGGPCAKQWGHLAALAGGFGELRVYNSRVVEVLRCSLQPAAHAAAEQLRSASPGTASCVPERALGQLCWSVGRLGPPCPDIHASLGALACDAIPRALQISTLAKVSWWSAALGALGGPPREFGGPLQAALAARLAWATERRRSEQKQRRASEDRRWNSAVSHVLWGLACQQWSVGDEYASTFWAAVDSRELRRDTATKCRLHQCLLELGAPCGSLSASQVELAASCRAAFLEQARRIRAAAAEPIEGTLHGRVGKVLRRASDLHLEHEAVLPNGYTVDLLLRGDGAARPVAVEVDGPSHFLHASQVPRGETLMKRRHLASQGLLVVPVPYWEWSALELMPISARVEYLRERLAG